MLKKLKRPTFFRVHTPRVRPRRAILPPWAGQKRVGGGGPPRGVTIIYIITIYYTNRDIIEI